MNRHGEKENEKGHAKLLAGGSFIIAEAAHTLAAPAKRCETT